MKNEITVKKMLGYTEKVIRYCEGCDYSEDLPELQKQLSRLLREKSF